MRFKIDWASLIVGSKFTVFALFYFVFEGNFPSTSLPRAGVGGGGLYLEGHFNGGFFALPDWGAYIWRELYMEELIFGILRYLLWWLIQNCILNLHNYMRLISHFFLRSYFAEPSRDCCSVQATIAKSKAG